MEGVRGGNGGPGAYRTIQNYVANSATGEIVYTPPSPVEVPPLMQELVAWLREESDVHPVLVAGIAQFQLVHIHPFVDGNGRTSRLLFTLCLYRSGYDFKRLFTLSELYDRDRGRFYRALQSVRARGMDLTGWLEFFVKGVATQLTEVKERGEIAIRSDVIAKAYRLNDRQALAIWHLLESATFGHSYARGTPAKRQPAHLAAGPCRLESKGLLQHEGETNNLVYRLSWSVGRDS